MGSVDEVEIPKVDFSGLDIERPGGKAWDRAKSQVMEALEKFSAFEAMFDERESMEVRDALLGNDVLKDAYQLPLETKMRNGSDKQFHGYIGPTVMAGAEYETFAIELAQRRDEADRFTNLLWPDGNPKFTDAVHGLAKPLWDLELMVTRMVAESLGIENHLESVVEGSNSVLRVTQYQAPETGEKIGLHIHTDLGFLSVVCQHKIPGLQIVTKDGGWAVPSLNSITVLVGDAFSVWTNGRLESCPHRVVISGNEKRDAAILSVYPKDGFIVNPPEELVDEEHPLQFKPFIHKEYFQFYFSEIGLKSTSKVRAYCGIAENPV